MNKDNAKDYLPLVQALADGKEIQSQRTDGSWYDVDELSFKYHPEHYRIKPEPKEIWVNEYSDGTHYSHKYECNARAAANNKPNVRTVRYREVVE